MSDPTLSESLRALQPWDLPGPTRGFWIHAGVAANLATQAATLERELAEARAEVERLRDQVEWGPPLTVRACPYCGEILLVARDRLRDALEKIGARCNAPLEAPHETWKMARAIASAVNAERAAIAALVTEVLG